MRGTSRRLCVCILALGAAASATASGRASTAATQAEATTDGNGRFELRSLPTGSYSVSFNEPRDRAYARFDGVAVNDTYGATLHDVRLPPATRAGKAEEYEPNHRPNLIRGNVLNQQGSPIRGVHVRARRQ